MSAPQAPSAYYRIDPLKGDNWLQWKRRILAIMRDRRLIGQIDGTNPYPEPADPKKIDKAEQVLIDAWIVIDGPAQTQIELSIGDSEMVHILQAKTAKEMWDTLCAVKEPRGALGVLSARRALYRSTMEEGGDMIAHIADIRKLQHDIHVMGEEVSDPEFLAVMVTSLPESWDSFTQAFFGATGGIGNQGQAKKLSSSELAALLIDEDRRRKGRGGNDAALIFRNRQSGKPGPSPQQRKNDSKCHNCGKTGHWQSECWSKGGGKEGQQPNGRSNGRHKHFKERVKQANEELVNAMTDQAYATREEHVMLGQSNERTRWYGDSGATSHLANDRAMFTTYQPTSNQRVTGIGGKSDILGRGTVELACRVGEKTLTRTLTDVMHVPDAPNCLISIGRFDDEGGETKFKNGHAYLIKDNEIWAEGTKNGKLYLMAVETRESDRVFETVSHAATWDEWHRRLAHTGHTGIKFMHAQNSVNGLDIDLSSKVSEQCEACVRAKHARSPFPNVSTTRAEKKGDLAHTDLWGPAPGASLGKSSYYISFTDDFTRRSVVMFLKKKSEAKLRIQEYTETVETQLGTRVKAFRSDKGGEYISGDLKEWAASKGIELQNTAPYSPSQNGIAERRNRTWLELARAMMLARDLPQSLWAEAIKHAVYVRNRVPGSSGVTPHELWFGQKPDVSHLRDWGCDVWIYAEKRPNKLAPRANCHIFVGFEDGPKAIRYYKRQTRQILVSRNFTWKGAEPQQPSHIWVPLEGENGVSSAQPSTPTIAAAPLPISPPDSPVTPDTKQPQSTGLTPSLNRFSILDEDPLESGDELTARPASIPRFIPDSNPGTSTSAPAPKPPKPPKRIVTELQGMSVGAPSSEKRSSRAANPPYADTARRRARKGDTAMWSVDPSFEEYAFNAAEAIWLTEEGPKTLAETQRTPDADAWQKAAQEEIDQLHAQGTWELVDLPPGRKAIGNRWVFTKKFDVSGALDRFKGRLVAQGFSQIYGVDFHHTYAPTLRLDSQRAVLALSAIQDRVLRQLDVKGAYLNGSLKEEIYMKQPEGFDDGTGRVCRLLKTLYGLKQAGREWNAKFNAEMIRLGFTRTTSDPCVYTRLSDFRLTIVTVWVDDLIVSTENQTDMDQFEGEIGNTFNIKNVGEPRLLIGMEIDRDRSRHTLWLRQTAYIDAILKRFGLSNCYPVTTPLDTSVVLRPREGSPADPTVYSQALGSLLYAAICTRPDISYAVQALSQFSSDPGQEHLTAVKRVFRYLKGTRDLSLVYGGPGDWTTTINAYTDADWASNDDRKSVSGFVFLLAGGAISWSAKKQPIVALSSTESEYIAATHAAKHFVWLRRLFTELGAQQPSPSALFIDNQSAMSLALDDQFHARTKHIDIRYHYIRELVNTDIMSLVYCPTREMLADIMTKGLARPLHDYHRLDLGLMSD